MTKQKSMKINTEKRDNAPSILSINQVKVDKENKDGATNNQAGMNNDKDNQGIKEENKIENSQNNFDVDPDEGIMVRSYSEGALKKFRALPNRS